MNEQRVVSQQIATRALTDKLSAPLLYLSSADAGWEGLVAQAFHEPVELEGWIAHVPPDVSLVLFQGGAMHLERRPVNGSWKALYMRQGDLILESGPGPAQ